jgi:hypothetical protein
MHAHVCVYMLTYARDTLSRLYVLTNNKESVFVGTQFCNHWTTVTSPPTPLVDIAVDSACSLATPESPRGVSKYES